MRRRCMKIWVTNCVMLLCLELWLKLPSWRSRGFATSRKYWALSPICFLLELQTHPYRINANDSCGYYVLPRQEKKTTTTWVEQVKLSSALIWKIDTIGGNLESKLRLKAIGMGHDDPVRPIDTYGIQKPSTRCEKLRRIITLKKHVNH